MCAISPESLCWLHIFIYLELFLKKNMMLDYIFWDGDPSFTCTTGPVGNKIRTGPQYPVFVINSDSSHEIAKPEAPCGTTKIPPSPTCQAFYRPKVYSHDLYIRVKFFLSRTWNKKCTTICVFIELVIWENEWKLDKILEISNISYFKDQDVHYIMAHDT